ncbi:sugar kinase [Alicyclobacillus fodiniaquatilis]|uniref:Sugar kinase n=1 Tax=Alicyclobacillus fodiniaquatilis TaxID=1661150 RepID=A0ABW4JCF4_9BACL
MAMDVCAIGELLVEVMRPSPNVPLYQTGTFTGPYPSGAPAIFIDALARLGVATGMIGCVGNDDFGKCVLTRLVEDGVDVHQVATLQDKTTAVAFVTYFSAGARQFLFHVADAAAGCIQVDQLDELVLAQTRVLHLNGSTLSINETTRLACYEAARMVKQNGGIVTFDPNIRPELCEAGEMEQLYTPLLNMCDYVLPSDGEAELLTGQAQREDAVRALLELGAKAVICKHGAAGCTLYHGAGQVQVPAFHVDVVDPTGAGDCFSAGFVYGLLKEWDWEPILTFANAMGALATRKQGPMEGIGHLADVKAFIQQNVRQFGHRGWAHTKAPYYF